MIIRSINGYGNAAIKIVNKYFKYIRHYLDNIKRVDRALRQADTTLSWQNHHFTILGPEVKPYLLRILIVVPKKQQNFGSWRQSSEMFTLVTFCVADDKYRLSAFLCPQSTQCGLRGAPVGHYLK